MKTLTLRATAVALLLAAVPSTAQQAASPPATGGDVMHKRLRGGYHDRMFASMSEAGRATIREAMASGDTRRAEHAQIKAARDRMLTLLEAERLDTGALKRAMDEERNIANASRERRQAAMLTAFGKLSVADRKAFVADSRAMKSRMEERVEGWRARRGGAASPL
jgi:Spy/CpxP family protein refolding chaperone